jgi:beta-lactamase family protein
MTMSMPRPDAETGLRLTLLNGDSSWLIELDGTRLLLDPWLLGDAVLLHPAFHVAHGSADAVRMEDLGRVDALIISHPFADHLSRETLRKLPPDLPAFAPAVVKPFLKWVGGMRKVTTIPNATRGGEPVAFRSVRLSWCRAATIMYCPHGLLLKGPTLAAVERVLAGRLDALLCSFTLLDLPGYLGGVANLGAEAGAALTAHLSPRFLLATHDGEKPDSGFVARVEKIIRCRDIAGAVAGRAARTVPVVPRNGEPWQAS